MAEKPPGGRPKGAGRAARPAASRQKPSAFEPARAARAARAAALRPKPPGREPAGTGRGARAAPTRQKPEDDDKVAPWREWIRVTLSPTRGKKKYPVEFKVSGLGTEKNTRY